MGDTFKYLRYRLRHSLPHGNGGRLFLTVLLVLALPVGLVLVRQVQRYQTDAALDSVALSFSPAQQNLPPDSNFKIIADTKTNQVGFIRLEFTIDTSKVNLSSEINVTNRLATVVQKSTMAEVNASGQAIVVAALQPADRTNPLTGIVELANFNVHATSPTPNGASTLSITNAGIQLIDMQSQVLPFTSTSASLILNPVVATNTVTPIVTTATTSTPTKTPTPTATGSVSVAISDFAFTPATITIPVGGTVQWTNSGGVPHTITSDTNLWDSGTLQTGQSFSRTFATAGTYTYRCTLHPQMVGTIIVGQTPTTTSTSTPTKTPTPTASSTQTVVTNTPLPTATTSPKVGDVNGDNTVNITDIGLIIDAYGTQPPTDARADLNKDGKVNIIDIGIVIDHYGN